jgi:hypothetical protein
MVSRGSSTAESLTAGVPKPIAIGLTTTSRSLLTTTRTLPCHNDEEGYGSGSSYECPSELLGGGESAEEDEEEKDDDEEEGGEEEDDDDE